MRGTILKGITLNDKWFPLSLRPPEKDYPDHRQINIKVDDEWFGEYYIGGGAYTVNIEGESRGGGIRREARNEEGRRWLG